MTSQPMNVVFLSGCQGDTQRYRCVHAVEQLRLLGHKADWYWQSDQTILHAIEQADILVLHRPAVTQYLNTLLQYTSGIPVVYETDDLIFDQTLINEIPLIKQSNEFQRQRWYNYVVGNGEVVRECTASITSTQPLADRLSTLGIPAWIHPNVLSPELLKYSDAARLNRSSNRPRTIGYFSGTRSHNQDFATIAPALYQCLQKYPDVRLILGGYIDIPHDLLPVRNQIEYHHFMPWQQLPLLMAEADVIIAPLDTDDIFACSRSALKYMEAGALGIPIIASPSPDFSASIVHGQNGFLAESIDDWQESLEKLIGNEKLRQSLGEAAYNDVHTQHTFEAAAPKLEHTLRQIIHTAPKRQPLNSPIQISDTLDDQWQQDASLVNHSMYMLTGCDIANAGNYRCRHRQQQLELHDIRSVVFDVYTDGMVLSNAITFEMAILHRVAWDEKIKTYISLMHDCGRPVIFDTDDLVFRPELMHHVDAIRDWNPADLALYRDGLERYQKTLMACDAAIVSTEPLAQLVRDLGKPVYVVRNALSWQQIHAARPLAHAKLASSQAPSDTVTIGYFSGSATHNKDFEQASAALVHVLARYPQVRLRIVGPLKISSDFDPYSDQIEYRDLVSLTALSAEVASVDIAIAPLELENPYCQAKSEVKYMEAAIVATPVVASPTEAFTYAIRHGENGMLAATFEEWVSALETLINDVAFRRTIGRVAYEDVLQRYTPLSRSRTLVHVLAELWHNKQNIRDQASFNDVFLHSLDLYEHLNQRNQENIHMLSHTSQLYEDTLQRYQSSLQTIESFEKQIEELKLYVNQLEQHIIQIGNGRVMRLLNRINSIKSFIRK